MEKEQIRRIIYEELPAIMRQDREVQQFILQLSREQFADKAETESRFDRVLDRLERDYQANQKLWAEYREERRKSEERWRKNDARLDAMLAEIQKLGQKHDSTIGALGARWGVHSEASFSSRPRAKS
jgi:hypothetical protein